jgi:hypothetical protein
MCSKTIDFLDRLDSTNRFSLKKVASLVTNTFRSVSMKPIVPWIIEQD